MKIQFTRSIIRAILDGRLSSVRSSPDPVFGIQIPESCPGVPSEILHPRNTWQEKAAFDAKARELARRFAENFEQFASGVDVTVREAGPKVL
jgi:phosphoenolpyruvate carboxykinase (ATP)